MRATEWRTTLKSAHRYRAGLPVGTLQRTVALLFGLSGNRCAFPDCNNRVISDATDFDEAAVNGHISHIYASSSRGPRPAPEDFDPKALDGFDNLILFCGYHNNVVDNQPNTFTAEQIGVWKVQHLRRNLLSRSSLLVESKSRLSVLGLKLTAFSVDARLIEVGAVYTKSKTVGIGKSAKTVDTTFIPYFFELDNGTRLDFELQDSRFNCAIGSRVSLLCAEIDDQKSLWVFSVYDHALALWTVLPRTRNLIFAKPREMMIVVLLMSTPVLVMSVLESLHVGIGGNVYGFGFPACALVGLAAFGFSRLREQIARAKLTALQNEVLVS